MPTRKCSDEQRLHLLHRARQPRPIIEGLMKRRTSSTAFWSDTGSPIPASGADLLHRRRGQGRTRLDAIVKWSTQAFPRPARAGRRGGGAVAFADVILLNKTDLVSTDELKKVEDKIRRSTATPAS
jgi:hypothetical protein